MNFYEDNTLFLIEHHTGNINALENHFHDLFEFYYLKNGTATYLVGDKIYNLIKGDIVVIPPNTLHKTISSSDAKRERILFYLDRRFLSSVSEALPLLPDIPTVYHAGNNTRPQIIFVDMLSEFNGANSHSYLKFLICELLILLKREEERASAATHKNSDLPKIISDVLSYITANYHSSMTLEHISKQFYINPSYLSRLFKLHTGFAFCDYVNKYRIKEANKLLTQTNMSVTQVAFECGFNSSNSFCKCYKKIMKTSPLAYRKYAQSK